MKYAWKKEPGEPAFLEQEKESVNRYGGYVTRHEYEKNRQKIPLWKRTVKVCLLLVLVVFAVFGAVALFQGNVFPDDPAGGNGEDNTIKVPTQQELSQVTREPEKVLEDISLSLVTVQTVLEDGVSRLGSGFLVSQEGHAICSSNLFSGDVPVKEIRVTTVEGIECAAVREGTAQELGFALIRLDNSFGFTPVSVGNFSFVKRGETYYAAASNTDNFAGTALSGIVAATGSVKAGKSSASVPVLYLDMTPNDSVWGAPVVDLTGRVIGFCSHTVVSPYGELVGVVSIHALYTTVNEMLGE